MTQTIELQWDEDVTVLGEHCPADKLERAKYAQFLTSFIAGQGFDETKPEDEQKKNYVLNLNSEWGSGKTYFLKRWYHDLKQHYPVVYVDAWKQDYSDDPLMTVISSMTKQLREQAGKAEDDPKFKAPRKALGLLKAALPSAAGALAKRYLGIDPVAIMEAADEGDVGETIKDAEGKDIDMGAAASKLVQYLLDEHDAKSDAISSLKKSVEQWIEAAKGNKKLNSPAFIFIDELDRCRPSYAVEMLETIKHIFDIPGVVFVVGTDTEQLQHAVKAIYGEGFDARTYLGRFFNSRCTLKKPSFSSFLNSHCDTHKLKPEYLSEINIWPESLDSPKSLNGSEGLRKVEFQVLSSIYECFEMSPRQCIQITNRLISTVSSIREHTLNLPLLVILLCLNEKFPIFYKELMRTKYLRDAILTNTKDPNINSINIQHQMILNLEPRQICEGLSFYSKALQYPSGNYYCSIFDFIYISLDILRVSNEALNSTLQQHINKLNNNIKNEADKRQEGKVWAAIHLTLLLEHEYKSRELSLYEDLVELSSTLD